MLKRIIITSAMIFMIGFSEPVLAETSDTTTATVNILKGDLSIAQPDATVNMGNITKDGTVQTLNANLGNMTVSDFTGTGSGWHVTASATPFTQTNGTSGYTLPANTFVLSGIGTITQTVGTSTLPSISTGSPWVIDAGAMTILTAGIGAGAGSFDIAFPVNALKLQVDTAGNVTDPLANPTTFQSTITWNIVTGP